MEVLILTSLEKGHGVKFHFTHIAKKQQCRRYRQIIQLTLTVRELDQSRSYVSLLR